jgi:hypothetical protein
MRRSTRCRRSIRKIVEAGPSQAKWIILYANCTTCQLLSPIRVKQSESNRSKIRYSVERHQTERRRPGDRAPSKGFSFLRPETEQRISVRIAGQSIAIVSRSSTHGAMGLLYFVYSVDVSSMVGRTPQAGRGGDSDQLKHIEA